MINIFIKTEMIYTLVNTVVAAPTILFCSAHRIKASATFIRDHASYQGDDMFAWFILCFRDVEGQKSVATFFVYCIFIKFNLNKITGLLLRIYFIESNIDIRKDFKNGFKSSFIQNTGPNGESNIEIEGIFTKIYGLSKHNIENITKKTPCISLIHKLIIIHIQFVLDELLLNQIVYKNIDMLLNKGIHNKSSIYYFTREN